MTTTRTSCDRGANCGRCERSTRRPGAHASDAEGLLAQPFVFQEWIGLKIEGVDYDKNKSHLPGLRRTFFRKQKCDVLL